LSTVTTKATMAEALRFALRRTGRTTSGHSRNASLKE
jgi:hypothetical protein